MGVLWATATALIVSVLLARAQSPSLDEMVATVDAYAIAGAAAALVSVQAVDGDAIRDRLDKYLFAYEPLLSSVVADERMTQRDGVVKVNGKALADGRPSLSVLLTDGATDDYDQPRLLLTESARRNLGGARATNLPNLPLEFLHPRNRHRLHHRLDGREKVRQFRTAARVIAPRP